MKSLKDMTRIERIALQLANPKTKTGKFAFNIAVKAANQARQEALEEAAIATRNADCGASHCCQCSHSAELQVRDLMDKET